MARPLAVRLLATQVNPPPSSEDTALLCVPDWPSPAVPPCQRLMQQIDRMGPQEAIVSVVAAVLHLGNIRFADNSIDEAEPADEATVAELQTAARLLQVCGARFPC